MFEDKTLICKECGAEFVFTAGEREVDYDAKGLRRTSRSAVRHAATLVRIPRAPEGNVRCHLCFLRR